MNTRLGKSFGLAFVVAVGILALMFALGTFNSQQVGAEAASDVSIVPASPDPGANVEVEVMFLNDNGPISNYGSFSIELEAGGSQATLTPEMSWFMSVAQPQTPKMSMLQAVRSSSS